MLKTRWKIPLILLPFLLLLGAILYFVVKVDYSMEIPQERRCLSHSRFNLLAYVKNTDASHVSDNFPYKPYLELANLCDVSTLERDIQQMDSLYPSQAEGNRDIFLSLLTEKLEESIAPSLANENLDSLILVAQWAERFNFYKDLSTTNTRLYKITYRYWFNFISNQLGKYYENNTSIKYNFKFKYLSGLCQSKKFSPPIGNTNGEKTLLYITEQKYAYLFNRFWNSTGNAFKLIAFLGLFMLLYSFYCVIKVHFFKK